MSDERQDSLAAQMDAWVPPWERKREEPDRHFQAETAEDQNPMAGYGDERAPGAAAAASGAVDWPQELPGEQEPEPTEVEIEPELPPPDSVEEAAEEDGEPEATPVDEPAPRSDAYLAGYHDTVGHFPQEPATDVAKVADVTPSLPPVPAPRREEAAGGDGERLLDDAEFTAALEAILLVVDEPTSELKLAEVLEQPVERVARTLDDLAARYTAAGHGFDLRRAAGGWRLYTRPEYAAYVERFVLDGQSVRLTQAALETLAVVAYKQPVTRSRISAIRGVNCDGVMRTLVTRGLIEEVGTEPETGAYLYRTTSLFLEKLGLNSVDQLPPLAPFLPDDVEEVLDASG
ncbi:SMC-Scp complex subunit ScpB [Actinoplanes siamensis]|uniref:Segregation and condensation protein B n=1 Tax=Actinoplanes siamensis TaxID=1223317 RepID=A0A919TIU9_9ACTN|nr:SMC-Scp complex subunit ScpB [Actinoplanes siamensis]GIF04716.1 hypothetical protein Asi03nite_22540 [Actinoplanes siamensis]